MKLPEEPTIKQLLAWAEYIVHNLEKDKGKIKIKGVGEMHYDSEEHKQAIIKFGELYQELFDKGWAKKTPGHMPQCTKPEKFEYVSLILGIPMRAMINNLEVYNGK